MTGDEAARLFKALGDANRMRVLELLAGGERCACVLLEGLRVTQPTLSHHMRVLCGAGAVKARKDGQKTLYRLDAAGLARAQGLLAGLLAAAGEA
ncbi:MAG: winged helix-turn-helix transcriptional regulator [Duodenibacillus sp.]|nr:winged helix-turn-helix transcriptional regulator [Duodenibacillus sp.]